MPSANISTENQSASQMHSEQQEAALANKSQSENTHSTMSSMEEQERSNKDNDETTHGTTSSQQGFGKLTLAAKRVSVSNAFTNQGQS